MSEQAPADKAPYRHPPSRGGLAPLACKTDRIDAWVLAELCRRDLVPAHTVTAIKIGPRSRSSRNA
jgi:hypothetical protein